MFIPKMKNKYIDIKFIDKSEKYIKGYGFEYRLLTDLIMDFLEKLDKLKFDHFLAFEAVLFVNSILKEYQIATIGIENINKEFKKDRYKVILTEKLDLLEKDIMEDENLWI